MQSDSSCASLSSGEPPDHAKYEFHNQDKDGQSETDGHDRRIAPHKDVKRWAMIAPSEVSTARHRGFFFALARRAFDAELVTASPFSRASSLRSVSVLSRGPLELT